MSEGGLHVSCNGLIKYLLSLPKKKLGLSTVFSYKRDNSVLEICHYLITPSDSNHPPPTTHHSSTSPLRPHRIPAETQHLIVRRLVFRRRI